MRTRLVLTASVAAVVIAGCGSSPSTAAAPTTVAAAPTTIVAAKAVTAQVFSPETGSTRV